jgi:hypothetical protein
LADGNLLYSSWDGSFWSQNEIYNPLYALSDIDPVTGNVFPPMLSADTIPAGGKLVTSWLVFNNPLNSEEGNLTTTILYAEREIPEKQAPEVAPLPTNTPTPAPTSSPTPDVLPSPTPQLDVLPEPEESSLSPLVVGAGITGLAVVILFVGWLFMRRKSNS